MTDRRGSYSVSDQCPTRQEHKRYGGYDIGVGLMFVGSGYSKQYSRSDQQGLDYRSTSVGTSGIGIIPRGYSLIAPVHVDRESRKCGQANPDHDATNVFTVPDQNSWPPPLNFALPYG